MSEFYVYAYYEDGCSEPFYIGKGSGARAHSHFQHSLINLHDPFHHKLRSLVRAGVPVEVAKLSEDLSENEAHALEQQLISHFGRKPKGCLYNLTDGGLGFSGARHSAEYKEVLRKQMIGNKFSQGRIMKSRRPILRKYMGIVTKRYDFLNQVAVDGFQPANVLKVIKGEIFQSGGYQWEYDA